MRINKRNDVRQLVIVRLVPRHQAVQFTEQVVGEFNRRGIADPLGQADHQAQYDRQGGHRCQHFKQRVAEGAWSDHGQMKAGLPRQTRQA